MGNLVLRKISRNLRRMEVSLLSIRADTHKLHQVQRHISSQAFRVGHHKDTLRKVRLLAGSDRKAISLKLDLDHSNLHMVCRLLNSRKMDLAGLDKGHLVVSLSRILNNKHYCSKSSV